MTDVNLDDLKIDHEKAASRKRFPLLLMLLVFLLGGACGFALLYFKPPFLHGLLEEPLEESNPGIQPKKNAAENDEKPKSVEEPEEPREQSFTEGGWVEVPSYHPVVVSALIPGRLEELHVLESSRVKKGDVIARLYQKDLEDERSRAAAELEAAEADLKRLRAGFRIQEVEQARADLEAAEADVRLKEQVLRRTEKLVETGAVSEEELDRDKAAFEKAKARRDTLEQELSLKEEGFRAEDIEAAEAELARRKALLELAKNRLDYTVIKSPMDGVVLERFVTPGTYIPASDPKIVNLYDPNDLQVRVDVRQENIAGVYLGQEVEVFTDVEPERAYTGEVIRIDPLADFKKNTIQVKIKLLDPSGNLYPEMIARIRFMRRIDEQDHGEN